VWPWVSQVLVNKFPIIWKFTVQTFWNRLWKIRKYFLNFLSLQKHINPLNFVIKECFRQRWVLSIQPSHSLNINKFSHLLSDLIFLHFWLLYERLEVVILVIAKEVIIIEREFRHRSFKNLRLVLSNLRFFYFSGLLCLNLRYDNFF
jgi:hypothetical protein